MIRDYPAVNDQFKFNCYYPLNQSNIYAVLDLLEELFCPESAKVLFLSWRQRYRGNIERDLMFYGNTISIADQIPKVDDTTSFHDERYTFFQSD